MYHASVRRIYVIILALRHHFYVTLGKTSLYNFLTMHTTGALTSRKSKLLWPTQGKPSKADWTNWRQHPSLLELKGKLAQPLGPWIAPTHQQWHCFLDPATGNIYDLSAQPAKCYHPIIRGSKTLQSWQWYNCTRYHQSGTPLQDTIPVTLLNWSLATDKT
jgi:hypothetical protein